MIDPRISLGVQAPKVSQALDIFERTKQGIASRDALAAQTEIAQAQEARRAALDPLNKQAIQQGIDINKQALESGELAAQQATENRILKSVNDFAVMNAPMINRAMQTQDPKELQQALIARKAQLTQQGLPTEQTDNAIMMLGQGNVQGVVEELQGAVNLYRQGVNQGMTSAQREHQGHINTIQDPNATPEQIKAAKVALGLAPRAVGSSAQTIVETGATEDVAQSQAAIGGKAKAVADAVTFASESNSKLSGMRELVSTYKGAIEQLDAGADTGKIYSILPSFDTNAMILDNIASQAGFNLAKSGGGIITEADMEWGMKTAIPQNLPPAELKDFLQKKVAAQEKIAAHINDVVMFLGDGDKTLKDWYKHSKSAGKITDMSDDDLFK